MKQNIIKLISLYLLSIFLISCGTSNNDTGTNNGTNNNTNNNQDDKNDNNNKPIIKNDDVIFTSSNKISVKENQLNAITLKATGNTPIVYSISGADSDSFSINSATGVVVFKTKPDYESKTTYNFTAKVKDSKNSEDEQNVIISILDEDEKPPLFISSDTLRIRENTLRVVTVKTKDESIVTYSITNEADGSKFDINAISGEITFKQAPDFESKKISYSLHVIAKDAKDNQHNQYINITIEDIEDETKPIWTSLSIASVFENQLNAITLIATDNSPTITYSIGYVLPGTTNETQVDGDDSSIFNVGSRSGKVTFKKVPDYESKKSYSFTAKATDREGNEATQNIIIWILDVDEINPKWVSSNTVSVQENQLKALTLKATDKNKITYSISGDDSDKFDVNNTGGVGVVSFKEAPDYESKIISYSFTATAKDSKDNISTQAIKINIIDIVDEIPPVWVSTNAVSVQENQLKALTLKATDENKITYSISGDDSDSFNIDSEGLITFKKHPNYELNSSYHFISKATDEYGNSNSSNTTVNITFISRLIRTFNGHTSSVHSLAMMDENITSGSGDNTIKIWDINTTNAIKTFTNDTNDILSIATTLDKKNILIGSGDNDIKLLDKDSGELIRIFTGHTDNVHSVIMTPNGNSILSAGGDETIRLWEINTSRLQQTFIGHTGGIHALAVAPDGRYVLSGSNDDNIKLWNIDTGALIRTFTGHTGTVDSLAITPDGKYFLSGSNDSDIKLWNIDTGALIRTFKGHTGIINSIKITPDGKYALSGSGDKSVKLWDINTGKVIRTFDGLDGHTDSVSSVEIIKNGKYALSGSWDHTLKLWDMGNL